MATESEINNLIVKLNVREKIEYSFRNIIESNTVEGLDIKDKKVSINSQNIEYSLTELDHHKFQTPILKNESTIGHFALIISNEEEQVDELFVIY